MRVLGLTGGIGSGKSTVSALLAARGAVVIDADEVVRRLQRPGEPIFDAMVATFGPGIVAGDGTLDRAAVARIVFNDPEQLALLNELTHPAAIADIHEQVAALAGTDAVVVLDVPLLVENDNFEVEAVVVVDVDPETAVARLVRDRGFDADDVRARMANQASRERRLARADVVLDNHGTPADLEDRVDELWERIESGRFPA